MISKGQINQQKTAISGLKKLVEKAEDSEKKERALAYCNGCIDACELALEQLKADTPKTEAHEEDVTEEPKAEKLKKRVSKKAKVADPVKEEPVKEEVPAEVPVEEATPEDDLEDLL